MLYRVGLIIAIVLMIGCSSEPPLTYYDDVKPIIQTNCVGCHQNGGAAPFALNSFAKVNRKKNTIKSVVADRYMPPWPADPEYSHFIGEKLLTDEEINTIVTWVDQGAIEGIDTCDYISTQPSQKGLGAPDYTVTLDSIKIKGNNRDRFLIVKGPISLPRDTFVKAIVFEAGQHYLVHHMNGHILNYDEGQKKDVFAGKNVIELEQSREGYLNDFLSMNLLNDDGSKPNRIHSAVNYLPGVEVVVYPPGIGGFKLHKTAAVVANDIHYGPVPKDYIDVSKVHFFFDSVPPKRPIMEVMMGTNGVSPINPPLSIAPGEVKTFVSKLNIPQDISVLTLNPHMHLLGKRFKAYALTSTLDTIPLIRIPEWNFRWQYFYTFPKMIKIPAGSVIVVEATFDNTTNNEDNPNNPPILVAERLDRGGEGMRTTDEMLQFIITYLPYEAGDENISLETN